MSTTEKTLVTIEAVVNAPAEKVWELWNNPKHVIQWNTPSPDWHTPSAESDLRVGGTFSYRMEAKDGSFGFDFAGTYDDVTPNKCLAYTIGDGRAVEVLFDAEGNSTKITSTFEAENQNPVEMQRGGWQAILDNFKKYAESAV